MVKINIVAVGKVKEKYFTEGINEYAKRISKFAQINIIEVQEENYSKVDDGIIEIIKEKECQRILPHLKGTILALAIEGKKYDSNSFSKSLQKFIDQSGGTVTFVIGGSYGLSDKIKKEAKELISFSDMTFPHTMFRLMLSEQIYRAFSIISGSGYHK
ncbi:MAG: 23S rRNA (pseudouridine(1915)-N(3))-methyltransferase RlmH [Clostridiales bacterium]|nr:23S rRNA (pseudouridine(1915)-N(3))-methyltransferase RlmH [Clostridiales bacterium]